MARYLSRAKGINTALDIVEEALINLQEKAERQSATGGPKQDSRLIRNSPQASTSDVSQEASNKPLKKTSVLIKRPPRSRSRNVRSSNSHTQNNKRIKTKNKTDTPTPEPEKNRSQVQDKHIPEQNLSSSSEDTPRRSRCHDPLCYRWRLRHRNKKDVESTSERLPHESTRCSDVSSLNHNQRYSSKHPTNPANRDHGYMLIDAEEEALHGKKHKSTRRSTSRSSHGKPHRGTNSSLNEDSDSVTSHREPRRQNLRDIYRVSHQETLVSQSTKSKSATTQLSSGKKAKKTSHSYAEPTLTSILRTELVECKETEKKENLIPFIPSGTKNKSFHLGVIIQKELGRLKNIPTKELDSIVSAQNTRHDNKGSTYGATEETVRTAMNNIEKEIAAVTKRISK